MAINHAESLVARELSKGSWCSVITLTQALLLEAYARGASDIHIDPAAETIHIRLRIDGSIVEQHSFPKRLQGEIIARLKILAGLRTDEHFTAQDGSFLFTSTTDEILNIRLSVVPTCHGENAVMRLHAPQAEGRSLSELGMSSAHAEQVEHALARSHGMILVTGPTGSGKTTTLYTLMRMLSARRLSLVTIEDPVEYAVPGITQIQTQRRSGITFAEGLRSILRQDPDVIMVGEIRDEETASLAVHAALTGHLILSTLHTNSAAASLPRLLDMKIEPYLVASTVTLVIAQRLIQKENAGRIGLFETLPVTEAIQDAIAERRPTSYIHMRAVEEGMRPLFDSA